MKKFLSLVILLSAFLSCYGQKYQYPGPLEINGFKIGDKVDTALFTKYGDLYFPNYLDGWNYDNDDQLPGKYKGLPIAIWRWKADSAVALTLLNDIVLNITVSYLTKHEKDSVAKLMNEKFGAEGKKTSYEQTHPLQLWITYWNLLTWETPDVIVQLGNSDMRKPYDPAPDNMEWNLAYSDFRLENEITRNFRKTR